MGPGIAAGPHCPFASGSAEAGLSQWAVSRAGNQDRSWSRVLRSPSGPKPLRCPRWLPVRAEALAVRRSADSELAFLFQAIGVVMDRSPRHRRRQDPWPKPWFRLTVHEPKPWVPPRSQLPGRNPVLPDPSGAEAPSEPVAARLSEDIAFCRAGPESEDPVSCLGPFRRSEDLWSGTGPRRARRPFRFRMGASRSLPPSHPLKGKPVLVRIAAASSAALPSASAGRQSEDGTRRPPGLWLGRLSPVAGRSSRPRPEAVTDSESHQADSACG
jgi:hypothetical protein